MFKSIHKIFFQGLAAVVPIVLTVYVLVWLGTSFESALGTAVRWVLPEAWYVPGMGLVLGLAGVFAVGLLLRAWLIRRIWLWFEALFNRLPVVRSVYGSLKDLFGFFSGSATKEAQQVVLVRLPGVEGGALGFVTRGDCTALPAAMGGPETVVVYLPMSYQLGGFTVMVAKDQTQPVNMSVEEALRFVLTAGMTTQRAAARADHEQ